MTYIQSDMMNAIVRNLPEIAKQLQLKNKIELLKLKTNYELTAEELKEVAELEAEVDD